MSQSQIKQWVQLMAPLEREEGGGLPHMYLMNGEKVSIQWGKSMYADKNALTGEWETLELGFPTWDCPVIFDWAETPGDWQDTVYIRVPLGVVDEMIESAGGIDWPKSMSDLIRLLHEHMEKDRQQRLLAISNWLRA